MKKLFACIVCFSASAMFVTAGGAGKALKIEGAWTATGGSSDGKKLTADVIEKLNLVVTIKEGKYTVSVMGNKVEAGTYKLDAKKPAHIDLTVTEGDDKGKIQLGLMKVDGDVMTGAFAKADKKDRPKDFEGGEGIDLTIMKRGK